MLTGAIKSFSEINGEHSRETIRKCNVLKNAEANISQRIRTATTTSRSESKLVHVDVRHLSGKVFGAVFYGNTLLLALGYFNLQTFLLHHLNNQKGA